MQQQQMQQRQQQQQQLQQQQMQQRQQLEENRKKLEEANRKRLEEQKKRQEEAKQQQEEQRAMIAIRRVIQKVWGAQPETLEQLNKELAEVCQKELDNCGSQKARMQEESQKASTGAVQQVEQIKEQRQKMEERRI